GGAIYVEAGGTCNITGGIITGNKAQFAPAIYVEDGGVLNVDQTAVIKDNEYELYGNLLEVYVDGSLVQSRYIKADTYTIDEDEMPLDYEHCCGYFLDEKLSQCSFGEIALTSESMGFAPRTADAEDYVARLYTRTANPNNFTFTFNSTTQTYDIKAKDTTISGHIVLPKEYENVQTSFYPAVNYHGCAFKDCSNMTGITFQEGLTAIARYTIYNNSSLTDEVVIPNSVTTIGGNAFYRCSNLTGSLIIPNSVTSIGQSAFYNCCGLTGSLTIPNSVTSLGEYAFYGCSGFTGDLTISNNITSIGRYTFYDCFGLTGDLTIPNSVTTIGDSAFRHCGGFAGKLTIGSGVINIEKYAFYSCSGLIGDLIIPNSVIIIGEGAFQGCSNLAGELTLSENIQTIDNLAFNGCKGLTGNLIIPNSVTTIGYSVFFGCRGFTGNLIIGSGVTSIGRAAFASCSGLTSVYIPSGITTISAASSSDLPFVACSSGLTIYTDVANNSSVPSGWGTYWNYYNSSSQLQVVYGCSLDDAGNILPPPIYIKVYVDGASEPTKTLSIANGITSYIMVESDMPLQYENCCGYFLDSELRTTIKNNTIDLSNGDVNIYTRTANPDNFTFVENATTGTYDIKAKSTTISGHIVLPKEYNNVQTSIYNATSHTSGAFYGCSYMTGITLQDGLTKIADNAFYYQSSLGGELIIPDSVISIGRYAFYYCSGLTGELVIPSGVTSIGESAFLLCSGFTGNLIIPDGVKIIESFVFDYCSGFTGELVIPNSVTSIGQYAFALCSGLIGTLTIPSSVKIVGDWAFYACTGLTGLVISEGVEDVCWGAFYGCTSLSGKLIIPRTMISLKNEVFEKCSSLSKVFIPSSVVTIRDCYGDSPFTECTSLTIYCEVSSKPSGWVEGWNYFDDEETYAPVVWGYTLSAFNQLSFISEGQDCCCEGVEIGEVKNKKIQGLQELKVLKKDEDNFSSFFLMIIF
ncbi:MAG: leucine-rich repeat domain-containing protein, partial [Clostridia bacterium]|nr:leucine-rich repeat domain-containing protein [Clostridia bacterium]